MLLLLLLLHCPLSQQLLTNLQILTMKILILGCSIFDDYIRFQCLIMWCYKNFQCLIMWCYKNFHGCPWATKVFLCPVNKNTKILQHENIYGNWQGHLNWWGKALNCWGTPSVFQLSYTTVFVRSLKKGYNLQVVTRNISTHWSGLSELFNVPCAYIYFQQ